MIIELDIMFFFIFQMEIGHQVEFSRAKFYMLRRSGGSRHITMPNYLEIATILDF